jgi:hypothetical protein
MVPTLVGWLALGLAAAGAPSPTPSPPRAEPVTLTGTALLLPEALKSIGVAFDPGVSDRQVVLRGDDGTETPLLSDVGSRALYQDARLRNRKAEIKGLRYPGLPYLEVVTVRVEDQGRLRTPEYYCEICSISVRYPQSCPCCQGEMTLRMRPESR